MIPMQCNPLIIDLTPQSIRGRERPAHAGRPRVHGRPPPTILLMDPAPAGRRAVERALRARRWRVRSASSAEDALRWLASHQPDLLISALSPGLVSGWDLVFHEAMEHPHLPILVLGPRPAIAADEAEPLVRGYFPPPLDLDELLGAARRCLEDAAVICIA